MKYLKFFEAFVANMPQIELSDKTIDNVLNPDFFEEEIEGSVIHIKNWNIY